MLQIFSLQQARPGFFIKKVKELCHIQGCIYFRKKLHAQSRACLNIKGMYKQSSATLFSKQAKALTIFIAATCFILPVQAQSVLTLDSCRALAIQNNKNLKIAKEKTNAAHYQRKAAFTNYFPEISATGMYMRNQKEFSLLNDEQKNALTGVGTQLQGGIQNSMQGLMQSQPALAANPLFSQLAGALSAIDIASPLNAIGTSIIDAFRTDTRNIYAGVVTLTQPLYMGGKIRAYNKITRYAEQLAQEQHDAALQDIILATDQAYWQVVSLSAKKELAEGYLQLLQKLNDDIEKMIAEGVATKADGLSVKVKVNEAEMTLTKVEDGLTLARMLLCQLCGLELNTTPTLADENLEDIAFANEEIPANMELAYQNRPELKSLEIASGIYEQKVRVTRSGHLPTLALMGNYVITNPSVFNSFENKFKGMFNVGVMLKIPICHWGEGIYKTKAAKAEARIARYQLEDAREKVELQVNQSAFQVHEAEKKLAMAQKNMEKANENLRYATLGFEEGVIPPSNVLEAHTAWLSAQSEKIDAQIDVRLTQACLRKATGTLE